MEISKDIFLSGYNFTMETGEEIRLTPSDLCKLRHLFDIEEGREMLNRVIEDFEECKRGLLTPEENKRYEMGKSLLYEDNFCYDIYMEFLNSMYECHEMAYEEDKAVRWCIEKEIKRLKL